MGLDRKKINKMVEVDPSIFKLSEEQIEKIRANMVKVGIPVRFVYDRRCLNIETGELQSKGINVIYMIHYWHFNEEAIKMIADWLGVTAYMCEDGTRSYRGKNNV